MSFIKKFNATLESLALWKVAHDWIYVLVFCALMWRFSSVQFSRSVLSDSLWLHELQHARPPCPSPTPGVYSNSCPLSRWCHPTISSSVVLFYSCLQSFPASGSFPMNQFFASGGQSTGVSASASVLPMNTQDWSPLGWTGWISLQLKGLSRVLTNTTVQKQGSSNSTSGCLSEANENINLKRYLHLHVHGSTIYNT